MSKAAEAFRTISEVADELEIPKHVLRFWEVKFPQIRPMKRGGGRRYYRPQDMDLLRGIRHLLHAEGYTIKGVQKILREQGVESVKRQLEAEAAAPARKGAAQLRADTPPAPPKAMARGGRRPTKSSAPSRHTLIQAAIAELRICRAILAGTVAPGTGSQARKPRQA